MVAAVTGALFDLGCNLEDVTTSVLNGHFAMLCAFEEPPGMAPETAGNALRTLAGENG